MTTTDTVGVEVTELSTNKQLSLSLYKSGECQNFGFKTRNYVDLYCESD